MIKKKICMLGSFAVGKTSLIQRYVNSIFSETYLTTIGVKIDQKQVSIENQEITLILWDIHGEDDFQKIPTSYLRGTSGYFLILDGTRKSTLAIAHKIKDMVDDVLGEEIPFLALVNKSDVEEKWEINEADIHALSDQGWKILKTSAKSGSGVEEAFLELSKLLVQ